MTVQANPHRLENEPPEETRGGKPAKSRKRFGVRLDYVRPGQTPIPGWTVWYASEKAATEALSAAQRGAGTVGYFVRCGGVVTKVERP